MTAEQASLGGGCKRVTVADVRRLRRQWNAAGGGSGNN